jgi:hypothetical protein
MSLFSSMRKEERTIPIKSCHTFFSRPKPHKLQQLYDPDRRANEIQDDACHQIFLCFRLIRPDADNGYILTSEFL